MKQFILIAVAFLLSNQSAQAFPGEVVQIENSNLTGFSFKESACETTYLPESGWVRTKVAVWLYIDYSANGKTRKLANPFMGTAVTQNTVDGIKAACARSRKDANLDRRYWTLQLNDIQKNNILPDKGLCLAKYYVATLAEEISLSKDIVADTWEDMTLRQKVVHCP